MKEGFVGVIIALPVLATVWLAWRIVFVEDREQRDRRIKHKGPVRIMTEIKPALDEEFWQERSKVMGGK